MYLTIGKPAEFGDDSLPIRGQCQPYTRGWQLKAVSGGEVEILHEDTYYACRQIQRECLGKALEEVRAQVQSMQDRLSQDMQETAVLDTDAQPASDPLGTAIDISQPAESVTPAPEEEGTVTLPKDEMEKLLRKRKKDFEF